MNVIRKNLCVFIVQGIGCDGKLIGAKVTCSK